MYEIEKGIPLPKRQSKYPFADMEIGDSFLMNGLNGESHKTLQSRISPAISTFKMLHPEKKFKVLSTMEGVRVWRIE